MSSSEGEQSNVLSSASVIMARHKKKKWRHKFASGLTGSSKKIKKLKKSRSISQSVGCLIESTTETVLGDLNSYHNSWGNFDTLSVGSTGHLSDDARSMESQDSRDSLNRLSVPVRYSDSGILDSSQESLLSTDRDDDLSEIGLRNRKHFMQHHACYNLEIVLKEGRDLVIRDSSGKPSELKLELSDGGKEEYMGYLLLQCTLSPKTSPSTRKSYSQTSRAKSTRMGDAAKKMKNQIWTGVVTIVLVEGSNLIAMDDNGFSDPYVKFKLGTEKYKSKHKLKTLNPRWLEQFDLRMFDDQSNLLELSVYDHDSRGRDDFMGRAVIDLSGIEKEVTHTIDQPLEDEGGIIKLLLTISGTVGTETISDLANYTSNPREKIEIVRKYGLFNSFKNIKDIGWLQIKVFRAQGLIAADFGGTSDPFCVLELDNARLQTQTEYKTLNPEWNKVFTFNVKDIHSILEVTVYDEDRDKKVEFLGKIAIPLLRIRCGEKRWYTLKDKKLLNRTKGAIMLEIDVVYNPLKSAIRTVNPREEKYMKPEPKFKIATMKRNIARVTQMVSSFTEVGKFLQSCFEWESKPRTITAFIVYLVAVWFFEPYMLPITLLLVFLKNLAFSSMQTAFSTEPADDLYVDEDDDDEDDETKLEKDEKKSVHEIYKAAQEVCLQVQQGMDMVASLGERFKNTFNWTVPWLSTFAVILLSIGAVILYFIPVRLLVMAWGINKFTKKLRAPNAIPNNELLDFLSRVPSDSELVQYKELRPDIPNLKKKRA
ncbi:Multiple C2 and transmembrane domain-containing protein 2,Multiple C2 and transmembrane domain-containing protein,Multiple C2 and transmembrane domain-containing protein 1 [Mytilus coruscus]|uniref:Multiple C2 and transmembrane domain-containing protein 2,Multiple C2 and transmembrane domain-containing protein,Multiple C2 and transmembrane domain-containing protein 1 n=1 Tax=Mytilus coruscus TaxID=42192 RepID=A0A6J8AQ47_MYTCO|nr:Multiple C2 and transmembrane domain-containing protein 2,Multiple C2 and transmembrane domain-containing protein,Multiple C2 and transmembrane domain-containing protein 1 [Mytilus coruscus]